MASDELLTNSRFTSHRRCSKLHELRYERGFRPAGPKRHALMFGTLVHQALEHWWIEKRVLGAHFDPTDEHRPLAEAFRAIAENVEADPFDKVKAQELMRGYHFRWKDEPYTVLAVESQFRAPIIHPYTGEARKGWALAGKLDAIVRDRRDDRILFVEHKTSSEDISAGSRYWLRLRLDSQLSTYELGLKNFAETHGWKVSGTVYDVIGKPKVRPLKKSEKLRLTKAGLPYKNQRDTDETPEEFRARVVEEIVENAGEFYQRGEIPRLQHEIDDAALDLWAQLDRLEYERKMGFHPRDTTACDKYGSLCDYFGVCSGQQSIDDPALFVQSDVIHPELEEE